MSYTILQKQIDVIWCFSLFLSRKAKFIIRRFIQRSLIGGVLFALLLSGGLPGIAQNTWTQKADFNGGARWGVTCFSIGSKGYLGTGYNGTTYKNDFWEYDPAFNTWTQKANFGGVARYHATGFSIGSKGYLGTGIYNGSYKKDFWEYDPTTNSWTQKADFGGTSRESAVGFSIGSKGYLGTGSDDSDFKKDFWEYDPVANAWTQKVDFGGSPRHHAVGFSIGNKGYLGTGSNYPSSYKDFWEYTPECTGLIVYADSDGDGYGDINNNHFATGCTVQSGYVTDSTDCNDANISIYPGAIEVCYNNIDDNCNELIDDNCQGCDVPVTLTSTQITSSTAKLKWLAINEALSYKVRYKITGSSEWTLTKSIENHKPLHGLASSTEYVWQVKSFCDIQPIVASDWSEKQFFTTDDLRLSAQAAEEMILEIYPNPVSSSSTISFFLNAKSDVTIELLDVNERTVSVITRKNFPSGNNEITFDRGSLSAGIYFLQLKTNEGVMMQKVVIQ